MIAGCFGFLFTPQVMAQTTIKGDLHNFINQIVDDMPRSGSNAYVQASATESTQFEQVFDFIANEEYNKIQLLLNQFDYQFIRFIHESTQNDTVYVIRERIPIKRGWGTYIWRSESADRNVHIQVPHPIFDNNTPVVGIRGFLANNMQYFSMAGTHRYANGEADANPPSDMARNSNSIFQMAHRRWSDAQALQLHGFNDSNPIYENYPEIIISNGTVNPQPILYLMRDRFLNRSYTADVYDTQTRSQLSLLGATQNPQGQWSASNDHVFIHVELARYLRTVNYQIGQINQVFGETFAESVSVNPTEPTLPEEVALHQNYPNPFNSGTIISYSIDRPGDVTVEIFDMLGRRVYRRLHIYSEAGEKKMHFSAGGLASGVYVYTLQFNNGYSSVWLQRNMMLIK